MVERCLRVHAEGYISDKSSATDIKIFAIAELWFPPQTPRERFTRLILMTTCAQYDFSLLGIPFGRSKM